jgi:hypothetical protein
MNSGATVQLAKIGPWQFDMPEAWANAGNEDADYFVAPGGEKGLYVKWVALPEPKASTQALAEYLQGVHLRSFNDLRGSNWEVVERKAQEQHGLVRSVLDIYDTAACYRVLSFVVCGNQQAIQISVHDYLCTDYFSNRNEFAPLAASIRETAPMV